MKRITAILILLTFVMSSGCNGLGLNLGKFKWDGKDGTIEIEDAKTGKKKCEDCAEGRIADD